MRDASPRQQWFNCLMTEDHGLPPTAHHVMLVLYGFMDAEGRCYPSMAKIARISGQSKRTVIRNIQRAEKKGWIEVERADVSRRSNRYFSSIPAHVIGVTESPLVSQSHQTDEVLVSQSHQTLVSQGHQSPNIGVTESPVLVSQSHHIGVTESPVLVSQSHPNLPLEPTIEPTRGTYARARDPHSGLDDVDADDERFEPCPGVAPTEVAAEAIRMLKRAFSPKFRYVIFQEELVAHAVTDIDAWKKTLDYWRGCGYLGNQVPKMIAVYEKYVAGEGPTDEKKPPAKKEPDPDWYKKWQDKQQLGAWN